MTYQRNETPEPLASDPAPILLQDENSGRDGRRYNEWHSSRPDAKRNAREAAEAIAVATNTARTGLCANRATTGEKP